MTAELLEKYQNIPVVVKEERPALTKLPTHWAISSAN
jgi:hypothetical protein